MIYRKFSQLQSWLFTSILCSRHMLQSADRHQSEAGNKNTEQAQEGHMFPVNLAPSKPRCMNMYCTGIWQENILLGWELHVLR